MAETHLVSGGVAIALQTRQPSEPIVSPSPVVVAGVAIVALAESIVG
jgi:hypothetical protein